MYTYPIAHHGTSGRHVEDGGGYVLSLHHQKVHPQYGGSVPKRERGPARVPGLLGEDFRTGPWIPWPGTMKEHGYVAPPSRSVGAVLGDLDVSTDAAWSTGHSAIHSLVTWSEESFSCMIDSVMVRQVRWTPACGHTEFSFRRVPLLFMLRGVRFTFLGWSLSLELREMNGLDVRRSECPFHVSFSS